MEKVKIGQITAPVGIKGEIRVFPYTDRNSRFSDITKVFVGESDDEYTISKFRPDKNMIVIKLKEVNDRNTSESLRGKYLYADKEEYELDEDSYFLEDLIGCSVKSDTGLELGKLTDVIQNTAQDIYVVTKADGTSFLVPAVKEFITDVDIDSNIVTIHLIEGLAD